MNKNVKRLSLLCTKKGMLSASLKELAQQLGEVLGYKVFRTTKVSAKRKQFSYGQGVDKLTQYKMFAKEGLPALEFTEDVGYVNQWLAGGNTVFGRKLLNSSCGKGIVVISHGEDYEPCLVYTKYKKKKREFRVHCFLDTVVGVTEKKRRKGFEGQQDTKIRNLANGYVFCQTVEDEPEGLRELAIAAARVSPSHFRGVDIGYNELKKELFVIEVNGGPGITGSNVQKYITEIVKHV
jgi:glutathione synthase/RimK-type ligase-like ATP-grasp enzyme